MFHTYHIFYTLIYKYRHIYYVAVYIYIRYIFIHRYIDIFIYSMNKIKLKKKRKCDGAILVHIKNEISGERHTEVMKTTIVWENFMQMYAKKHGLQRKQLRFLFQTHNKSGLDEISPELTPGT